eukprot:2738582-Amphidinium_carterae.1
MPDCTATGSTVRPVEASLGETVPPVSWLPRKSVNLHSQMLEERKIPPLAPPAAEGSPPEPVLLVWPKRTAHESFSRQARLRAHTMQMHVEELREGDCKIAQTLNLNGVLVNGSLPNLINKHTRRRVQKP